MILAALIVLTVITVAITSVELNAFNTAAALLIAAIKATLVLLYFMHLKFDNKIYLIMTVLVILLLGAVITTTVIDYL